VDVVELAARVMARAVTAEISEFFQLRHIASGIRIHLGVAGDQHRERRRQGDRRQPQRRPAHSGGPRRVGVGVLPNVELAAEAGLPVASGIIVNEYLLTADENISRSATARSMRARASAARCGSSRCRTPPTTRGCVAARLTGKSELYDGLPWFWSDQGPDKLQMVGLTTGYDRVVVRGRSRAGGFFGLLLQIRAARRIESVNRAGDHMFGRRLLAANGSITPEQAAELASI